MEKFVLSRIGAREELNVVHQENIALVLVEFPELVALVGTDRLNDFFNESLGRAIADFNAWTGLSEAISDRFKKVGFAEPSFPRNKEGIVDARLVGHSQSRGVGKLVAFADDKGLKRVLRGQNFTQNSANVRAARPLNSLFHVFK
jgi:hypothetical protein